MQKSSLFVLVCKIRIYRFAGLELFYKLWLL
jgi:hypothetical protein